MAGPTVSGWKSGLLIASQRQEWSSSEAKTKLFLVDFFVRGGVLCNAAARFRAGLCPLLYSSRFCWREDDTRAAERNFDPCHSFDAGFGGHDFYPASKT